jgi:AcrR family transcriptional regulator
VGRPAKFDTEQMLDAAQTLLLAHGPGAVSMQGLAARLGAPSGSVYHRFARRDLLMASLWLRSVERFQVGLFDAMDDPSALTGARRAAAHVLTWSRSHRDDALILLRYRSADLLADGWPEELKERNLRQRQAIATAFADLCARVGVTDPADVRRVRFAVIEVPYAAARNVLDDSQVGEPGLNDTGLDDIVDTVVTAALAKFSRNGECP